MAPRLAHHSLHAILNGTEVSLDNTKIVHYRGIRYAKISRRFAEAEILNHWGEEEVDCRRFGPQCPQNYVNVGHLLRIPEVFDNEEEFEQDEFKCLNVNVTLPSHIDPSKCSLPVIIWIHGGSQVVSFPPVAHTCSDTTPLVSYSVKKGKPIIMVTFNYRLNIFGFGDGSVKNLALKDQRLAIEWVAKHIAGFGGDKNNITLAGESAGAVYVHAHITTKSPVRRAILQSGSLYLSQPLPVKRGDSLLASLSAKLIERNQTSIHEAPVSVLLDLLRESNINTLWIQQEPDLLNWEDRLTEVEELLIGDVEYESVIWRNGLETVDADEIVAAFDTDTTHSKELKYLYGISPTRPNSCRNGTLDFITDVRFALPAENIARLRRKAGKTTYQYLFDQTNPWQSSSRAHHGVDLVYLFGGYDLSFNRAAAAVGEEIRDKWLKFINGDKPWNNERRFVFGPYGNCGEIDDNGFAARRRVRHFEVLKDMDSTTSMTILGKLTAGRISLLN